MVLIFFSLLYGYQLFVLILKYLCFENFARIIFEILLLGLVPNIGLEPLNSQKKWMYFYVWDVSKFLGLYLGAWVVFGCHGVYLNVNIYHS